MDGGHASVGIAKEGEGKNDKNEDDDDDDDEEARDMEEFEESGMLEAADNVTPKSQSLLLLLLSSSRDFNFYLTSINRFNECFM